MRSFGGALADALLDASGAAIVVAIRGELGAGKTTLVRGVINALGIKGSVRSPTYTLIEPYEAHGRHIYHLDLYRLAAPQEVEALGVRDLLLSDAVLLIEWPERGIGALPDADLTVAITYRPSATSQLREVTMSAGTATGARLMGRILKETGERTGLLQ